MQQILAMTRKEILLWTRQPGSWIVVFLVPFFFIWIMQAVFGSTGSPVITVYAVTEEQSPAAQRAMQAMTNANNLHIEALKTRDEADRRVGAGERMAAIIIPRYFERDLASPAGASVEIIIDPARAEQANLVVGLVNAALSPMIVDAEVQRATSASVDQVMQSVQTNSVTDSNGDPIDPQILKQFFTAARQGVVSDAVQQAINDPQVKLTVQPVNEPSAANNAIPRRPSLIDYLVPGYSLMFVFFLISDLADSVLHERQVGTLRRILVMPIPRSRILLGKMLPFFLIGVLQMTLVFTVSQIAFHMDLDHALVGFAILIIASSLAMACLGILIAALARSEAQANGLTIILVLSMAIISGASFPNIFIPGLQQITPHYWAIQGFINIIARGQGVQGVLLPAGVLITMAAVFFTIGAIRFRFE